MDFSLTTICPAGFSPRQTRSTKMRILWKKYYDDNWGRWEKPIAVARCPWKGLHYDKDAAMILLGAVLAEELGSSTPELDRFHMVTDTGLLSLEELDAVADAVWGGKFLGA
jgi:hypothetical protein